MKADLYKKQISALLKDMSPVLDDSDAAIKAWLNAPSRLSQAFVALFAALLGEYNNVGPEDWKLGSNLEKFIELSAHKVSDGQAAASLTPISDKRYELQGWP